MILGSPFYSHIPTILLKQRVIQGSPFHSFTCAILWLRKVARISPFHSHISTKYIGIEGGSKQLFPISFLHHFMVAKGGSGQPLSFPHFYKCIVIERGSKHPFPPPIYSMVAKGGSM